MKKYIAYITSVFMLLSVLLSPMLASASILAMSHGSYENAQVMGGVDSSQTVMDAMHDMSAEDCHKAKGFGLQVNSVQVNGAQATHAQVNHKQANSTTCCDTPCECESGSCYTQSALVSEFSFGYLLMKQGFGFAAQSYLNPNFYYKNPPPKA